MTGELDEVLQAFERLVAEHEAKREESTEEDTNFRCVDCTECSACRFCTACERCTDCNYCDACTDCERCTQCRECLACAGCSHTNHTAYCEKSSYLTLCVDCDGCVQCFACVGLTDEEFCILNQRYTRGAYFKKVGELRAALDVLALEGWFPPWVREAPPPEPPPSAAVPRVELPRREASIDAPTVHPEPLTEIAAAERTGSWPPIDHESARALDRAGGSPWDALDEDAQASDDLFTEPDTIRRRLPTERESRPTAEPATVSARDRKARPRAPGEERETPRPRDPLDRREHAWREPDPHRHVEPPRDLDARAPIRGEHDPARPPAEQERGGMDAGRGSAVAERGDRDDDRRGEAARVQPSEAGRSASAGREAAPGGGGDARREAQEPPAELDADAGRIRADPSRWRRPDPVQRDTAEAAAQRWERGASARREPLVAREAGPLSLLDEGDDAPLLDKDRPRALLDGVPRAAKQRTRAPEAPQPVEIERDGKASPGDAEAEGRLTRGQRPTRGTEPPERSHLRRARRPRRRDS